MVKRHELIDSEVMGRPMHLWRYGHFGVPCLVYPSASGMAHEWESHGMVDALSDLIDGGRIKLYCAESNVSEAWTRQEGDPAWRIRRHIAFEQFVVRELVPWIRADCHSAEIRIATMGCSLGGSFAANFSLKFPELFHWALCMSGRYDMTAFTSGFVNSDVYFNNPLAYLPNLEGAALERVRRQAHLVLVCGQGAWEDGNIEDTLAFAALLARKGISHEKDIWGHDAAHEWAWWRRQARYHLDRAFAR